MSPDARPRAGPPRGRRGSRAAAPPSRTPSVVPTLLCDAPPDPGARLPAALTGSPGPWPRFPAARVLVARTPFSWFLPPDLRPQARAARWTAERASAARARSAREADFVSPWPRVRDSPGHLNQYLRERARGRAGPVGRRTSTCVFAGKFPGACASSRGGTLPRASDPSQLCATCFPRGRAGCAVASREGGECGPAPGRQGRLPLLFLWPSRWNVSLAMLVLQEDFLWGQPFTVLRHSTRTSFCSKIAVVASVPGLRAVRPSVSVFLW